MIGILRVAFDLYEVLGDNIVVVDRLIYPSTVDIKGGFGKRLSGSIIFTFHTDTACSLRLGI